MEHDNTDLPEEFVIFAARKAAAYNPRPSPNKRAMTPEQVKNKTLLDCTNRLNEVRAQVEGISDEDANAIVRKCLTKGIREIYNEIGHHHKMAALHKDKAVAVAEAQVAAQQRANARIEEVVQQTQQAMLRLEEKIDQAVIAPVQPPVAITDQGHDRIQH